MGSCTDRFAPRYQICKSKGDVSRHGKYGLLLVASYIFRDSRILVVDQRPSLCPDGNHATCYPPSVK